MAMSMICLLAACAAIAEVASVGIVASLEGREGAANFQQYMVAFGRNYHPDSSEHSNRQDIFRRRMELITLHNAKPGRLWTAGMNHLTDRTDDELKQLRGWRHKGGPQGHSGGAHSLLAQSVQTVVAPPEIVDWRKLTMASSVADQGSCGSCWAVATASMLQGRYEAQTKRNRTFSAQQLVNCVPNPKACGGSGGCGGATVELAMDYVALMGLSDEGTEPYIGSDMVCEQPMADSSKYGSSSFLSTFRERKGMNQLGLQSWHQLPENQALPLMLAVSEGPVAVTVGASDWFSYRHGIFNSCSKDVVVDHAVVLFGYGQGQSGDETGIKYWLVRNSWGSSWGETGFIRLFRQATPEAEEAFCGTDYDPKSGVSCKPYPEMVRVCGQCGILYDSVSANFGAI